MTKILRNGKCDKCKGNRVPNKERTNCAICGPNQKHEYNGRCISCSDNEYWVTNGTCVECPEGKKVSDAKDGCGFFNK